MPRDLQFSRTYPVRSGRGGRESVPKVVELLAKRGAKIEVWNRKNKWGWTPLLIAQGFRVGNFKPSPVTIAAFHRVMLAAGVTPPSPPSRKDRKGY